MAAEQVGPTPGPEVLLGSSTVHPERTSSAFELAAKLGYDGIELMVGIDPLSTDIDYVAKLCDYHQVPVRSVHAPCLIVTPRVWGTDHWEKLRVSAQAARRLGADVVVVHPPFRWQRDYARTFVRGINALIEDTGVIFAVENMYPWQPPGARLPAYLPDWDPTGLDLAHLTLDLSHASTAKRRSLDFVESWGPRLAHLHLTDGTGSSMDEHLFPGEGDQDAWRVLHRAVELGFRGHVVHEISTRKADSKANREALLADCLATTRATIAAAMPAAAPVGGPGEEG